MPATARLSKIYLPMASANILAGIKTSAVINVGTATIAALIQEEAFDDLDAPILRVTQADGNQAWSSPIYLLQR